MGLQRVALRESSMTNVAFVRLFARVNSQVTLQFVRVRTGVGTMRALIRSLASVAAHMTLQLGQLDASVVTLTATMRLFVRVPIAHVTDELAGRSECRFAIFTLMRSNAGVRVDVILKRRDRLEATLANATLVRALFAVRLHVTRQQIAFTARVIAVVAHVTVRTRRCRRYAQLCLLARAALLLAALSSTHGRLGFLFHVLVVFELFVIFFFLLVFVATFERRVRWVDCNTRKQST